MKKHSVRDINIIFSDDDNTYYIDAREGLPEGVDTEMFEAELKNGFMKAAKTTCNKSGASLILGGLLAIIAPAFVIFALGVNEYAGIGTACCYFGISLLYFQYIKPVFRNYKRDIKMIPVAIIIFFIGCFFLSQIIVDVGIKNTFMYPAATICVSGISFLLFYISVELAGEAIYLLQLASVRYKVLEKDEDIYE